MVIIPVSVRVLQRERERKEIYSKELTRDYMELTSLKSRAG